jgi:hypothetical protein
MSLNAAELLTIETLFATPDVAAGVRNVRRQFPHLSVTRCDPSDLDADTPFRHWPHLSLYLVDGSAHCWRLTDDPAQATGLVVVAMPRARP